ncbi:MAG: hypothetical protein ACFFAS_04875 [Promethearchaeota archaeon]
MPDVRIKTPNLDDIFEKWKNSAARKDRKKLEKQFGTKGAVFSLDAISAAEYVTDNMKEAAIYFAVKKTVGLSSDKDEDVVIAPRLSKVQFYSFKGAGKINKDNWKGNDSVPVFESITTVQCKRCKGKGYEERKCSCKGAGKITATVQVLEGEQQEKVKKTLQYPCPDCYGEGNLRVQCKECKGYKNLYKYQTLPVPFKTVVTGVPVLHSSAQTKYEKEIEKDLHQLIEEVEGIRFTNFKELTSKAEASLGYYNKKISKTISDAKSDYNSYDKDKNAQIQSQIYLFPMIQLMCTTKKGSKFEIYSIGSDQKFMIYSNF